MYSSTALKYNFEVTLLYWSIFIFHYCVLPLHHIVDANIAPLPHDIYLITLVTSQIVGCIRATVVHLLKCLLYQQSDKKKIKLNKIKLKTFILISQKCRISYTMQYKAYTRQELICKT